MISFRCDASTSIGMGHLMRCRALASAFRTLGQTCVMIGPSSSYKTAEDEQVFTDWIEQAWESSASEDATKTAAISKYFNADYLVLDDSRVDEEYQQSILENDLKWLQFDGGFGKILWADFVVNASPAASPSLYEKVLRKPMAQLLLGPQHAIVRRAFAQYVPSGPKISNSLLVMFGGGDDRGAMQLTLHAVIENLPKDTRIIAVSGQSNPRNEQNKAWSGMHGSERIQYLIDPPNLPALMNQCTAAVLAGGTTTYEANLFALPMVLIAVADNQIAQSKAWHAAGHAIYIGELKNIDTAVLVNAIKKQLTQKKSLPRLVDGLGGLRVANAMLSANPAMIMAEPLNWTS